MNKLWKTIAAIAGITILEVVWVQSGHNGASLALAIATIGGLAGYSIGKTDAKEVIKNAINKLS